MIDRLSHSTGRFVSSLQAAAFRVDRSLSTKGTPSPVRSGGPEGSPGGSTGGGGRRRFYRTKVMTSLLGIGLVSYAGYQSWRFEHSSVADYLKSGHLELNPIKLRLYAVLPLNALSRAWGWSTRLELPASLRAPLIGLYARTFGCSLDDALVPDLTRYRSLGEFFTRTLRPGIRPIDISHSLTSPSDGVIVHCGPMAGERVEQIKGMTYSLDLFLGEPGSGTAGLQTSEARLVSHKDSVLYQCVIYLAPGDYHRFHSAADWAVSHRKYFPGLLLSVNPKISSHIPDLFAVNERAVYFGRWRHGFFSMALVGALNVGSITVYEDKDLVTNSGGVAVCPTDAMFAAPLSLMRGDAFGQFNLGSTIVLIFEAPPGFKFTVKDGQRVLYGQAVGN